MDGIDRICLSYTWTTSEHDTATIIYKLEPALDDPYPRTNVAQILIEQINQGSNQDTRYRLVR